MATNLKVTGTLSVGGQSTLSGSVNLSSLTASRVLTLDGSNNIAVSAITPTELGYLDGVTSNIQTQLNSKAASTHTHSAATSSTDGFMSAADKSKLDSITSGANSYTHPTYTPRSSGLYKITVDTTGHVSGATAVTKSDITALGIPGTDTNTWTAFKGATSSAAGTAGYVPAPSAGDSNRYFRSDGTWAVPPDTNTTYTLSSFGITASADELNKLDGATVTTTEINYLDGVTSAIQTQLNGKAASSHTHANATTSTSGFMSAEDKSRLDDLVSGDNGYVHPIYTSRPSGLYKITVDTTGHVSEATAVTKTDITDLGIPESDTNTWTAFQGATSDAAGTAGYVPAPSAGESNRYFRSDGTWAVPPDTNTTYTLGSFGITATATELNKLDGVTVTATEINYLDGVTSAIQTQLNGKAASDHTHTEYASSYHTHTGTQVTGLTTSRALVSNSSGQVAVSNITSTELSYLDGVTSNIQTQLNGKAAINHTHANATTSTDGFMSAEDKARLDDLVSGGNGYVHPSYTPRSNGLYKITVDSTGHVSGATAVTKSDITALGIPGSDTTYTLGSFGITATATELNYVDGVTSNIQTQLNNKAASDHTHSGYASSYHTHTGVSSVTSTELGYLDGVTSNIQTQLNNKASVSHTHSNATTSSAGYMSSSDKSKLDGIASGANNYVLPTASSTLGGVRTTSSVSSTSGLTACPIISGVPYYKDTNTTYSLSSFGITATSAELNYVDGVTSNIQTQLNGKCGEILDSGTSGMIYVSIDIDGSSDSIILNNVDYTNEIFNCNENTVDGTGSHAEGIHTTASGDYSHAECLYTTASGPSSHAEGHYTIASGNYSHTEGYRTKASGNASHAEGTATRASASYSHAEGNSTEASGEASHAEGHSTASGNYSHAEGYSTIASSDYQHVQGQFNVEDTAGKYAHIIGWGATVNNRKNIFTVSTGGAGVFASSCTATSHPTSSSRRFKENFRDVDIEESEKILSLETKKFDFKEEYGGMKDRVGFIAEDVEPIFPNCVSYDEEGTITGIDYSSFVPYMIDIIKKQQKEIDELKSKINQ